MRADVDADMELLWCLQEGLGLTAQQEALLLETRRALLGNLRVLVAERNALCQQLNVSTASHLSMRLHIERLQRLTTVILVAQMLLSECL